MINNHRQRGFSFLEILALFVVIAVVIFIAIYVFNRHKTSTLTTTQALFTTQGSSIMRSNGQKYVPLGVTVFGLSSPNWQSMESGDLAQIKSSASFWHANIVRIQVAPYFIDNNTPGFLSALKQEVSVAEQSGLNVIISAQYERTNGSLTNHINAPDQSTVQFWQTIAPLYSHDTRVWFELFNEPTGYSNYSDWKNGGNGLIGMQTLVNDIRLLAPDNIIVAESIDNSKHFEGIANNTLDGSNIVYAVHPYFNSHGSGEQPLSWWQNNWSNGWGFLAASKPLLISEWGEYEAHKGECQINAPQLVPAFLSYISSLHLGLIGWSLTPGAMISGNNLNMPNSFNPNQAYTCKSNNGINSQGAGADILNYFENNGRFAS